MSVFVESFLQNKNQDVRVNVGYMSAGESESYNIIPATAKCEVEIRSANQIRIEKERMQELFQKAAEQFGVQASIASEFVAFDAYTHAPEDAWIQQIQSAMEAANIEPITEPFSYGASDANLFQQQGINVAVLGNGVQNTHSVHEKVLMEALETTTTLLRSIVTTSN